MIRWNMNISYRNSYGTGSELRSIETKYCLQESIGSLHHTLSFHIGFGKNHSTRMNSVGKGRIIQPGWTASESRKQKSKIVEEQKTKVFRSCKWPSWFLRKFWLTNFLWNDRIFIKIMQQTIIEFSFKHTVDTSTCNEVDSLDSLDSFFQCRQFVASQLNIKHNKFL